MAHSMGSMEESLMKELFINLWRGLKGKQEGREGKSPGQHWQEAITIFTPEGAGKGVVTGSSKNCSCR